VPPKSPLFKRLQPLRAALSYHHDKRIARLKLESIEIKIDRLTPEPEEYLAGWSEGKQEPSLVVGR
jgi:S-adenosylhomocysteine hydrolase